MKFKALHLKNRTFVISGLSKQSIKDTKFSIEKEDGQSQLISVFDYFKKNNSSFVKNLKFDLNAQFPCIQVGSRKDAKYFPIECCYLIEGNVYHRKLRADVQSLVTRISSNHKPIDRFNGYKGHITTIENDNIINGVNYLKEYGVSNISNEPTKVKGRILFAPKIVYKNGKEVDTKGQGSWNMGNGMEFYQPCEIGKEWALINIGIDKRFLIERSKVDNLIDAIVKEAKSKGIKMFSPNTRIDFNYEGKEMLDSKLIAKLDKNIKFTLVLIPQSDNVYDELKSICELKYGIITVCINEESKFLKENNFSSAWLSNIFLKINTKCGGINHAIKLDPFTPLILKEDGIMFIGLDVSSVYL